MIPAIVLRKFLNRPRRDCSRWKSVAEYRLDRRAARLPVTPPIWSKLRVLQKVSFLLGALSQRFYFLLDLGTGKTLLIIALVRYFERLGVIRRFLVLVPNRINKFEWVEQIQNHSPRSTFVVLQGTTAEKWKQIEETDSTFIIETYAGLVRLLSVKKLVKSKRRAKAKMRLVPDIKAQRRFSKHIQGMACDESFAIQKKSSLAFRLCRWISKNVPVVYAMTGTPFNRDPISLWAQMFVIDFGETLGETLGLFRATFFKPRDNGFGTVWKFDRTKQKLLNGILSNRSISYEADQATLPAAVPVRKTVALPEEASVYYQRAVKTIIESKGNVREMKNAFVRLRQISSGFVGYYDDDAGEKAKFEFDENPKLEMLLSIVKSVRPEHKVVIFFEFTHSGERIVRELKALGVGAVLLHGKTKNVSQTRDQFKYDKHTQVLVLQNQFGLGLNIQVAKYAIFFESPVSASIRKQCRRRVERQHSTYKTVFIYDLIVGGTVDEAILSFHKQGRDLFNAIVRGKVKLFGQ